MRSRRRARMSPAWYFLHRIRGLGARQSIASAPRDDVKSLDLTEFLRFLWFSYDFSKRARAGNLYNFCEKKHWVDLLPEIIEKIV